MIGCYAIDLPKEIKPKEFIQEISDPLSIANAPSTNDTSTTKEEFEFIRANSIFHMSLIQAKGHSWLIKFYQTIETTMARCQVMFVFQPRFAQCATEDHQKLLDSLRVGAYDKGKKLIRDHINYFPEFL